MPQPCVMWRPWRSPNASIIARGGAAPPTVIVPDAREVPARRVRVERLEDPHPDRRHARADRDLLLDERVEEALRVEMRPGEDLLRADERAREREAPRVCVEHRDDRKDGVALVDAEEPGGRQRVDRDRAMRVDDALRQPGRPAREAHRGGLALVDVAVRELALVGRRKELLVVDRAVRRLTRAHRDHVLERRRGRRTAPRAARAPCRPRARGRPRGSRCTCCRRGGGAG